jgi:TolA-binding protein
VIAMSRTRSALVLCALLAGAPAFAQETPAEPATTPAPTTPATTARLGRDPDAWQAYKDAQGRFDLRMRELETDTKAYVEERQAASQAALAKAYDTQIADLTEQEKAKRTLAIERFEDFLLRYPDAPYSAHVRFRLADLYWEKAKDDWLTAQNEYAALEERLTTEDRIDELPPSPMMELDKPVGLYERIISDNLGKPKDQQYEFLAGTYYALGFVYREDTSAQFDEERSKQAFRDLIAQFPESPFADDAHVFLGNFMFESNDFEGSLAEYDVVLAKGPASPRYEDALYQEAWALYKLDRYDQAAPGQAADHTALGTFTKLLDFSEEKFKTTGQRSEYAPEATRFMAFSFADMGEDRQQDPTKIADAYFARVGPRDYEWDVYRSLGQVLTEYGRFGEAIPVYRKLQDDPRWRLRPENPEFQMQIAKIWVSAGDLEQSGKARVELTERYSDDGEWGLENRHNPDAIASARTYIRESLEDVAIEFRKDAEASEAPADYVAAATKFAEYLDKFPMSDDYYQIQFFLADSLYRGLEFDKAAKEYESLIRSRRHHTYGDGSYYQLMRSRQQIAEAKYGPLSDERPADAQVERTYTSAGGKEITVYAINPEWQAFMNAADQVLAHDFKHPDDPTQLDWKQQVDDNRSKIAYLEAKLYYLHNHFDEARPRLLAIIENQKCTDEADYAANYIVDSYTLEGDLQNLRVYTKRFLQDPPGCKLEGPSNAAWEKTLEGATFKQAGQIAEVDRAAGADAFLDFLKEFPNSEYANLALYNAASSYDVLGKPEKANELYQQYVEKYPKDDRSAKLYYVIAANYEQTFELQQAIDYYGRLLKNFPDDPNAADALYQRAFLKIGLGDHAGAAQGFEDYVAKYSDREDAADVEFKAGEQWEQVGASQAIAFYDRYRKKYGLANPDHALACDSKVAAIYKEQGNTRKYNEYLDKTEADFDAIVADGRADKIGLEGRHAAAEGGFRDIKAKFDQTMAVEKVPSLTDPKALDKLTARETRVKDFRVLAGAFGQKYGDFDYAMAALYMRGAALAELADWGLSFTCPESFDDEQFAQCQELLDTKVYPQYDEDKRIAVEELNAMISIGKDKKLYSEWIGKGYELLNEIDPLAYPAQKQTIPGGADATLTPTIQPVRSSDRPKKPEVTP